MTDTSQIVQHLNLMLTSSQIYVALVEQQNCVNPMVIALDLNLSVKTTEAAIALLQQDNLIQKNEAGQWIVI